MLIQAKKLSFAYEQGGRRHEILRDIDLAVDRGEFVAIQGPSGSGKSTLFYLLGCLLRPTSGQVLFEGHDVTALSESALAYLRNRRIGFVFQQFHLLPRASVMGNVLLPAHYPSELSSVTAADRLRAAELITQLGLADHQEHHPNQLSGGQQQRVAIARALLREADLILADEPTGNLDSKSAAHVLDLLRELHAQGKTVVLITHDASVAQQADRVITVRDGQIADDTGPVLTADSSQTSPPKMTPIPSLLPTARLFTSSFKVAAANLARNKTKSALTMLGVVIGVAAVLATLTLGEFAKTRILEGYETLGVNKLIIQGYSAERLSNKKKKHGPAPAFESFHWQRDVVPLKKLFPTIELMSPVMTNWQAKASFGGRSVTENVRGLGVSNEYFAITSGQFAHGGGFSPHHLEDKSAVCVLGSEVGAELRMDGSHVGQLLMIGFGESSPFTCKLLGILAPQKAKNDWFQPNRQIVLPFTTYQTVSQSWYGQINQIALKLNDSRSIEPTAAAIKAFFEQKYDAAAKIVVDTDSTMVAQMKRFLSLFSLLLAGIATLSLVVGGIGIHNMMLVSIADRLKEIGLRKALGATGRSIKVQVLLESLTLCSFAGLVGVMVGFAACGAMMYGATKLIPNLAFEWIFNPWALLMSTAAIVVVGVMSGLAPASRAESLQVIEALRSE